MTQFKPKYVFLKISLLVLVILIGSVFLSSCSMINTFQVYDLNLVNTVFFAENNEYILRFNEKDAVLKNQLTALSINFDYIYNSGIILGKYTEGISEIEEGETSKTEEKELVFALVQKEILYSQNLNLLFKLKN